MSYKQSGRYQVPMSEDYEPGSNNEVLKNFLHINEKSIIEKAEEQELERAGKELVDLYDANHTFTAKNICYIHEVWLGNLYPFAGTYRTVNMEKGGFPFAGANRIAPLMEKFEHQYLKKYTPCHFDQPKEIALALGIVHVELIIIHPFREGNGRTARLLANLMSLQADQPVLNYDVINQTLHARGFKQYVEAIHSGFNKDYQPIQTIFYRILEDSKLT